MFTSLAPAHPAAALLIACWAAVVTPWLVRSDFTEHRLPNRYTVPGWAVMGCALLVAWIIAGRFPLTAAGVAAGAALVLGASAFTGAFGMGDVKLAVPLAAGLAFAHPVWVLVGAAVALVVGAVAALVTLVRERSARARIAFGPWLLCGYWVAYLC